MNLILVKSSEVASDGTVVLDDDRADHIRRVLRKDPGDSIRLGVINGGMGVGTLTEIGSTALTLSYREQVAAPPRQPVDLLLAMPRPRVMKRLWAHLASLGVGRITITGARRVERYYFDSHALRPEVIESRLVEGLTQAGDTHMPAVNIDRRLRDALARVDDDDESGRARILLDLAPDLPSLHQHPRIAGRRILLAVGPEGGWSDDERALLAERGFAAYALGPRVLRCDTACVVALSIAHHLVRAE